VIRSTLGWRNAKGKPRALVTREGPIPFWSGMYTEFSTWWSRVSFVSLWGTLLRELPLRENTDYQRHCHVDEKSPSTF
jgi:hypothetical protein